MEFAGSRDMNLLPVYPKCAFVRDCKPCLRHAVVSAQEGDNSWHIELLYSGQSEGLKWRNSTVSVGPEAQPQKIPLCGNEGRAGQEDDTATDWEMAATRVKCEWGGDPKKSTVEHEAPQNKVEHEAPPRAKTKRNGAQRKRWKKADEQREKERLANETARLTAQMGG
eukprot:GEMP01109992.1.p2 GENE.GEMP01109992.1~~GEMP01109992.1.p2  ORF type:complete len:167 (+),score=35.38 GEMP01109992.1:55-555(+)